MTATLNLLLHNARLATGHGVREVDLGVAQGRVAWLAAPGSAPAAREHVDLAGRLVLPGLIDAHTHFREPGGHAHKGTYASESRAAAAGGVTTVLTMPNTVPFTGTRAVLEQARQCARASVVDYGFHFGVTGDNAEELRSAANVPAFKAYLNETTGISSPLADESRLAELLALGHPVVAHAEADTLDLLLAVHRQHGAGLLYIAHVALAREVDALRAAKATGQPVFAEVTPHHLFLTEADFQQLGPFADMRPTLKQPRDVEALWDGLADGTIDTVATDHAPHLRAEKEQMPAPPGVPGLQTMLPLLLTAVHQGRLSLDALVRLTSQRPAAIFALRDKGEVRVGAHADLVVVDLAADGVIRNEEQLTLPGWTPFDGWDVRGRVEATYVRGQRVFAEGRVTVEGGGREVETRSPGAWLMGVGG